MFSGMAGPPLHAHNHSTLTDTVYRGKVTKPFRKRNTMNQIFPKVSDTEGHLHEHKADNCAFTSFRPPRVLFQRCQERRQHQFHSMSRKLAHDNPSCVIRSIADILTSISKTQQQMWQDMNYVWFKQSAQHVAKHLKCKQST
jgi:hypothetical protein